MDRTRILIVEDDADFAKVLGLLLETSGHAVDTITDPTQCLSHVATFRPNVVLLDIAMPRVSGYQLAQDIRARFRYESLAIIAMSGYVDPDHQARSIAAGCDQHLVKPVKLEALETAIDQQIQRRTPGVGHANVVAHH